MHENRTAGTNSSPVMDLSFPGNVPLHQVVANHVDLRKVYEGWEDDNPQKNMSALYERLRLGRIDPGIGDGMVSSLIGLSGEIRWVLTLAVLCIALSGYVVAAAEGNFANPLLAPDALHDIGYFSQFVLGLPTLVFMFSKYYSGMSDVFLSLVLSGVIPMTGDEWTAFQKHSCRTYGNKVNIWFPYFGGAAVLLLVLSLYIFHNGMAWFSLSLTRHLTYAGWLHVLLIFMFYYLLMLVLSRSFASYFVFHDFFSFHLPNVQPLHPDGCGGFGPLHEFSKKLYFGLLVFGIVAVSGVVTNINNHHFSAFHPINILVMLFYFITASVIFFMPLYKAHKKMKKKKEEVLHSINSWHEPYFRKCTENCSFGKRYAKDSIEKISRFKDLHETALKMPVFPFNAKTVVSFVGSVGIPLLAAFADKIIALFIP